ncbi:helix-turn-helix transcriptional regulator [Paraflavitalea speifideaquila]|uniref:helix-turn-helix transcriptional regulator n=1 Tax=Paraflavitalea speifideaquila TaxID=3076558 RepID=UPI0028E6B881|nr:helix-turn-helix transcriptional regulator [Paraflavitalea speifideiaquila]
MNPLTWRISCKACFSRFHFHRLFSRIYRKTPHQYLTRKRLDKAQELLAQNKGVTEVCNEVGFESISSFSVLFKKEVGIGPQHYRNMQLMKNKRPGYSPGPLFHIVLLKAINWQSDLLFARYQGHRHTTCLLML